MDDTIELLNQRYSDLEQQWQNIRRRRDEELAGRVQQLDKSYVPDPWMAAGIAGLYGRDPFSAYNQAELMKQAQQTGRYGLIEQNLSEQEKEIANLMKSVQSRISAKNAAQSQLGYDYETKVFGDNFIVTNRRTGVPFVMGVDQAQLYMGRVKQYVDELSKIGGQDMAAIQAKAHEMAQADLMNANSAGRDLTGMTSGMRTGKPQPGITPPVVATPVTPGQVPTIAEDAIPPNTRFNFTPDYIERVQKDPNFLESELKKLPPDEADQIRAYFNSLKKPATPSTSSYVPTPEEKRMAEKQYEEYAKEYTADREAISSIKNMAPSIGVMKQVLQNPKVVNVGPMHEQLTQLGGFMNYIDPNSTLAQAANSTPVYFSNMMNLVRDKIKALGSGTAISNLDFIVTQKSVGDLRNTAEGNKRLLAIMELQNASLMDRLQRKVGYFESGKQGYKGYENFSRQYATEPSHIVRRNQNTGEYYIQSKQDWLNEQAKVNNTTPDKLEKYWADQAVKATTKLLAGTGIQFGGK